MSVEYEKRLEERIHRELMKVPEREAPETLIPAVISVIHGPAKLEQAIQQQLATLPEREAPEALIASVMGVIQARAARPWWRKPIPQWPRRNQFVFVAVAMALVCAAVLGIGKFWPHEAIADIPAQAAAAMEPVRPAWSVVETLTRAAALLVSSLTQPWLIALGFGFLFVYLSCIGMGMAWYRVTFQKPRLAHA
jgi:type VI protein secretion system component VasF